MNVQLRFLSRLAMFALLIFTEASVLTVFAPDNAHAQQVREKRSILEMLFGKPTLGKRSPSDSSIKRPRKRKTASTSVTDLTTDPAVVPAIKSFDAKTVLVIGDFMAKALGDGLNTAFLTAPDVVIDARSNGSSGLVRPDYYNWPTELPKLLDEVKPAALVVILGANDRQQMSVSGTKEKFRSDFWNAEYLVRVSAIADIAANRKVPLIWVGLPPFQSASMSADAATLNEFYNNAAQTVGGEFVDIWDGFADESGKFITSGSDINGQSVRLRGSDGLSFTKAGKRKLAFYLEKPIRHAIGNSAPAISAPVLQSGLSGDTRIPETVVIVSTPPISLSDPELDGSTTLMDANLVPKGNGQTPRDLLVQKGDVGTAPIGRVDDFRWKPQATAQ